MTDGEKPKSLTVKLMDNGSKKQVRKQTGEQKYFWYL